MEVPNAPKWELSISKASGTWLALECPSSLIAASCDAEIELGRNQVMIRRGAAGMSIRRGGLRQNLTKLRAFYGVASRVAQPTQREPTDAKQACFRSGGFLCRP